MKLQTDVFQPKPPTPKYVPKKTGIDKITQIEDYDLFDYDVEVQPIETSLDRFLTCRTEVREIGSENARCDDHDHP